MNYIFRRSVLGFAALAFIVSCQEESICDTTDFAIPSMSMTEPVGQEIEANWDSEIDFTFTMSAEAGLNTFSMNYSTSYDPSGYPQPIWLFADGETEATIHFKRYFYESATLQFVLHDLCNQSTSLSVKLVVLQPPK